MKLHISFSYKHFSDFLTNRSNISFFVSPTDKKEIENIISSLNSNKSVGPNSIPTKVLKLQQNLYKTTTLGTTQKWSSYKTLL